MAARAHTLLQMPASDQACQGTGLGARLSAALLTGLLGLVMLFGVGFAQIDVVHNAAHDTRHSVGFPCH